MHIKTQLTLLKASRNHLSFDDLLTNLAEALLDKNDNDLLAHAIRRQYRIAMIDEFQDTDPLQYRIFNKIYLEGDPATGLFMIGDPKQAIYAFRGADIFTYMQAREQVHSHFTLGTNWRSSDTVVAAVNRIFQLNKAPFIYDKNIPFKPVTAAPKASDKRLTLDGDILPSMTLWLQQPETGSTVGAQSYLNTMAEATATEINRLLSAADRGECLVTDGKTTASLQPGDIAVLVRSRDHGKRVREALSAQNIASIYMSNKDSVFTAQEAIDLGKILAACLHPTSERPLKAALATSLLHLDAPTLDALNENEQDWEDAVDEFTHYAALWQDKGILPMLRQLIFQRHIADRLLTFSDGERRLTDLMHLGELLATASIEHQSPSALARWFREQLSQPNNNADDQQLHLESERNLVKIITIHKSKGLEYKVVFVPFPCHVRKAESLLYHNPETGKTWLALTPDKKAAALSEQERLAEDLRLLYVALTRAVHCCYLGMAPYKSGKASKDGKTDLHLSAIGYLLNNGQAITSTELADLLQQVGDITHPLPSSLPPYVPLNPPPATLVARHFIHKIERNWWTTSYSALSRHHGVADASVEQAGFDTEVMGEQQQPTTTTDPFNVFNFPKGAQPGTFMHSLFEELDLHRLRTEPNEAYLNTFVLEHLTAAGYEQNWLDAIKGMLFNCLNTPLDGDNLRLIDLQDHNRRVEMEFYLPIAHLDPEQLNQLIARHDPLSAKAGALQFNSMKGMLKGFIDLTFEYQGRWYVLDYKSNWLGSQNNDYNRGAIEKVMIEHRYDLQYQLYALALHRLLKQRLTNYDYEQHFGGVIYLFLRGVQLNDSEQHGIFSHKPDFALVDGLDQLFQHSTQSNQRINTP